MCTEGQSSCRNGPEIAATVYQVTSLTAVRKEAYFCVQLTIGKGYNKAAMPALFSFGMLSAHPEIAHQNTLRCSVMAILASTSSCDYRIAASFATKETASV